MMSRASSPPLSQAASGPPRDARLFAPATARNRAPIAAVLARWLPPRGRVLELASGSGEHAVFFAAHFPDLDWQPSDPDPRNRASIAAHCRSAGSANLRAPLDLDVTLPDWPLPGLDETLPDDSAPDTAAPKLDAPDGFDAMICCNMIHIAPWAAAEGLFAGAARYLRPRGGLFLYGPFIQAGVPTAPSNEAFDASLRARDPAWGLRSLERVAALAEGLGFAAPLVEPLPANNLALWFVKQP
jgi:SAM-dependent methyltransferase